MATFSRFFPFLRPYLTQMTFSALLVMGVAALNLILIRFAGNLWDLITVQRDLSQLTAGRMDFSRSHAWTECHVYGAQLFDFARVATNRGRFFVLTFLSIFSDCRSISFSKRRTGEIVSRLMNDVGVIQATLTETPIDSAKHIVTVIGGVGFLLVMNWRLCVLILLLLPLLAIVARLFGRRLKSLSTKNSRSYCRADDTD